MAEIYDKALFDRYYSKGAWQHGVRDQPRIPRHHYNWFVETQSMNSRHKRNAKTLFSIPDFPKLRKVAFVGGGFGWGAEQLLAINPRMTIFNVETSPHCINCVGESEEDDLRGYLIEDGFDPDTLDYFVDPKDPDNTLTTDEVWSYWLRPDGRRSHVTLIDSDLSTKGQRSELARAFGGQIDAIVTEVALDSFETEEEIDNFLDAIEMTKTSPNTPVFHLTEYTSSNVNYISKKPSEWREHLDSRDKWTHRVLGVSGDLL